MSDFIKFCPKCYTLFRDADLYQQHVAQCGTIKEKEAAKKTADRKRETAESRRQTAEETADRRRQTAAEGGRLPMADGNNEESGSGYQKEMTENSPETVQDEFTAVCGQPSADFAEGDRTPDSSPPPPKTKSPKFKT